MPIQFLILASFIIIFLQTFSGDQVQNPVNPQPSLSPEASVTPSSSASPTTSLNSSSKRNTTLTPSVSKTQSQPNISANITPPKGGSTIWVNYVDKDNHYISPPGVLLTAKQKEFGYTFTGARDSGGSFMQIPSGTYTVAVSAPDYDVSYFVTNGGPEGTYSSGTSTTVTVNDSSISVYFKFISRGGQSVDTERPNFTMTQGPVDNSTHTDIKVCFSFTAIDNITPPDKIQMKSYFNRPTGESMFEDWSNNMTRCYENLITGEYVFRVHVRDEVGNEQVRIYSFRKS